MADEKLIADVKDIWWKGGCAHRMSDRVAENIIARVREETGTSLGGRAVKDLSKCACEGLDKDGDCGCAFGQCAKGLIF